MFCFQKDHENVEAPFYFLAKEFHNLYNVKIEQMKTLTWKRLIVIYACLASSSSRGEVQRGLIDY